VWDIRVKYGKSSGNLELFWNEREQGPSLALQTVSDGRELDLITVRQGEEHTLAAVETSAREAKKPSKRKSALPQWLPYAVVGFLVGMVCVWLHPRRKKKRGR
jgi:hypothetical protein